MHAVARHQAAVGKLEGGLQHAARIGLAIREPRRLEIVMHRASDKRQSRQERHIDTSQVLAFDQYRLPIARLRHVVLRQAGQDGGILDLLERDDVRTKAIIDLQDRFCDLAQLEIQGFLSPVELEAVTAPEFDLDRLAPGNVLGIVLDGAWQVRVIVLARIVRRIEQVLDVEGHDRDLQGGRINRISRDARRLPLRAASKYQCAKN